MPYYFIFKQQQQKHANVDTVYIFVSIFFVYSLLYQYQFFFANLIFFN